MYKKDDEADTNNYRPISLLTVPSKIIESCVSESIVRHVFQNNLVTDKQWAYREGHSTELLLVHLSEIGTTAIDPIKWLRWHLLTSEKLLTVYLMLSYCTS